MDEGEEGRSSQASKHDGSFIFSLIIFPVARTCNLIFIVLDVLKPLNDKRIIEDELEGFGIRLNKKPPNVTVRKKEKGGPYSLFPLLVIHNGRVQVSL
jgi:ribosome-interacting GTPase 1